MTRHFMHVRVGDPITPDLSDHLMPTSVTELTETRIVTAGGWQIDRGTGAEIDDDLPWGPAYGTTGSFLVGHERGAPEPQ